MKLNPLVSIAVGLLLLAGCASNPAQVSKGPIRARTFSFVNPGTRPSPAYSDQRQHVHELIQTAITKAMADRGVQRVDSGGDVTVGYLVIVGNNASVASVSEYFSHGEDAFALEQKALTAYSASKNPNYFTAGTLVMDIVDSKTFKLLMRGHATRQDLRELPADARLARLQGVVDEILRDQRFTP